MEKIKSLMQEDGAASERKRGITMRPATVRVWRHCCLTSNKHKAPMHLLIDLLLNKWMHSPPAEMHCSSWTPHVSRTLCDAQTNKQQTNNPCKCHHDRERNPRPAELFTLWRGVSAATAAATATAAQCCRWLNTLSATCSFTVWQYFQINVDLTQKSDLTL